MLAILTTILLDLYIILLSFQVNGVIEATDKPRLIIFAFLLAQTVAKLCFIKGKRAKNTAINIFSFVSAAVMFIVYMSMQLYLYPLTTNLALEILFFPICVVITYVGYSDIKKVKVFDRIIDLQFYYLLVVAGIFILAQIQRRGDYKNNINTVYYLVFSVPFILQNKSKMKRNIGLIVLLSCVFISLKRAPVIALGIVFIFMYKERKAVPSMRIIRSIILVGCIFVALDYVFYRYFGSRMIDRVLMLGGDGGSGRLNLIKTTIDLLRDNSLLQWLFGHELKTTYSIIPLGAHNDFLEVIFRMGLVGFLLFINYFVSIAKSISVCKSTKDMEDTNMLQSTMIIFAVIAFSSQLIFLPTYVGLIAMSCNVAILRNRCKTDNQRLEMVK